MLPPAVQTLEPAPIPRLTPSDVVVAEVLQCEVVVQTDHTAQKKKGIPNQGTWLLVPKPEWEESVTMEIDFTAQDAEIAHAQYYELDGDDDISAFSLQINPGEAGPEVIQHFTLTESGLVEE